VERTRKEFKARSQCWQSLILSTSDDVDICLCEMRAGKTQVLQQAAMTVLHAQNMEDRIGSVDTKNHAAVAELRAENESLRQQHAQTIVMLAQNAEDGNGSVDSKNHAAMAELRAENEILRHVVVLAQNTEGGNEADMEVLADQKQESEMLLRMLTASRAQHEESLGDFMSYMCASK